MIRLVPTTLREANAFVKAHHRRVGAKSTPFRFPLSRKTAFCSFAPPFALANASLVCEGIFRPVGLGERERGPRASPAKRVAWGEEEGMERAESSPAGRGRSKAEFLLTRTGKRCPAVDLCPPQMKLRYEKLL